MSEPSCFGEQTIAIERCLQMLRDGDTAVRGELLNLTQDRLIRLTAKMKRDFRGVGRWEQTEDVFQNASMRLYQAMSSTKIDDTRHFFRLAALQIRRELIDLCRHYRGPQGQGANHATQPRDAGALQDRAAAFDPGDPTGNPAELQAWSDFHECVDQLPDREREVFELLWYHELKQDEVAELLGVSTRSVKRLWRSARLMLHDRLNDSTRQSIAI
ncbi:sigma-70 family RNA polymerase sigma factor [Novipirellula artificiosorum]|uniref:RNA polymerase sigma factor SigV n=1 Tax=Novipirellula artificiosorum TaxID=2528016 RepID=A0A5C6CJ26_9BACT|nr:sigma-70 family RNA polymerase sigma factor [Novipirellula artificiosorum]TWU24803.1 RNA polymerase sigma factor SigV [Novipirellula artificiosorum]